MEERVRAIREMADAAGIHLVINARTDVFLVSSDDTAANIDHAVVRGNAYRAAGADSVFVPDMGDMDRDTIAALVNGIDAPINLIAGPNTPPVAELTNIGVGRLSLGPRPMRACLTYLRRISRQLQDDGTFELMNDATITYADVQGWYDG
jgi:2-methylisocitrate lyase-like PEP mutase family enzyme